MKQVSDLAKKMRREMARLTEAIEATPFAILVGARATTCARVRVLFGAAKVVGKSAFVCGPNRKGIKLVSSRVKVNVFARRWQDLLKQLKSHVLQKM